MMILIGLAGIALLLLIMLIVMPAFRVAPFAYGASRLRAARARFISKKELKNLAHLGYHDSLVAIDEKKQLHLSELVNESFPEEKVQRRIREYRLQCMYNIIQYTPNKYKPFFKILLSKETLEFVMGAIRAKLNPTFAHEVLESMFTDREFSVKRFSEMSLDEVLTELEKTSYGEIITQYRADILAGDLEAFEEAINKRYYTRLQASANDTVLQKCAKKIIDIQVVKTALCFNSYEIIKGNSFSPEVVEQLQKAKTVKEVKQALEHTYLHEFIAEATTVTDIFKGLYHGFDVYASALAMQQPLSLNQMVSYYVSNIIEIKNLRILLKLSHAQFAPEQIEEAFI